MKNIIKKIPALVLALILVVSCAAFAEEDGQNPVMNIIGDYADEIGQRATMSVYAGEGSTGSAIISWSNSAFETVIWEFSGEYDTETNTLAYDNCLKSTLTYDDDGNETAVLVYDNGTGKLVVNENWTIIWVDDVENAGENCLFSQILETEENGQNPVMNIIGSYQDSVGERATLDITVLDDGGYFEINWASSAEESTRWQFTGRLEDNVVVYTDCWAYDVIADAEGSEVNDTHYENGTGTLTVNEDWTITWQDDMENAGEGCVFTLIG